MGEGRGGVKVGEHRRSSRSGGIGKHDCTWAEQRINGSILDIDK